MANHGALRVGVLGYSTFLNMAICGVLCVVLSHDAAMWNATLYAASVHQGCGWSPPGPWEPAWPVVTAGGAPGVPLGAQVCCCPAGSVTADSILAMKATG